MNAREAEKNSYFWYRADNGEDETTSAIPEQQPHDDNGAYPPRNDSLGKKAATRVQRATTLPSKEADTSFPDSSHTNVSEPSSEKDVDKIRDPKMLQPISRHFKNSTTSRSSTDNSDSQGKESGARVRREPFSFGSIVDELFRSDSRTPGRLVAQASSTDSGDDRVQEGCNRRPSRLVSRVEEFLRSNGKIKDRAWLKKRARRLKLGSISMGHPVTLQDFLSKDGSNSEHTEDPEIQTSRRRKLRRTQSFSDLRHNVKSDGTGGENKTATTGTRMSQATRDISKTTHSMNANRHLMNPPMVQTQWDILGSAAPMDTKGTSSADSMSRLCK